FDVNRDRFLVNVREPACVVALAGGTADKTSQITVSAAGPHGLDLDPAGNRAFVAYDAGCLVMLDLTKDAEIGSVPIGGEPDAIWFNLARQRLYVAIGKPGSIDVVDCQGMTIAQRVATEDGAH